MPLRCLVPKRHDDEDYLLALDPTEGVETRYHAWRRYEAKCWADAVERRHLLLSNLDYFDRLRVQLQLDARIVRRLLPTEHPFSPSSEGATS